MLTEKEISKYIDLKDEGSVGYMGTKYSCKYGYFIGSIGPNQIEFLTNMVKDGHDSEEIKDAGRKIAQSNIDVVNRMSHPTKNDEDLSFRSWQFFWAIGEQPIEKK